MGASQTNSIIVSKEIVSVIVRRIGNQTKCNNNIGHIESLGNQIGRSDYQWLIRLRKSKGIDSIRNKDR